MSKVILISGDEVVDTSSEDLTTRVEAAKNICEEFNNETELRRHDSREFNNFLLNYMVLCYNPAMITDLGFDKIKVIAWAKEAGRQAMEQLYTGTRAFEVGRFGSIWFDSDLTGNGKTKKTRVCLAPYKVVGDKFEIMLDATFDEQW